MVITLTVLVLPHAQLNEPTHLPMKIEATHRVPTDACRPAHEAGLTAELLDERVKRAKVLSASDDNLQHLELERHKGNHK
jgi:hypothetical protein